MGREERRRTAAAQKLRQIDTFRSLKLVHEGDERFFLVVFEFQLEDEVEEFDGVFKGEEAAVVEVGRRIFDAAEGERFDRALFGGDVAVDGLGFVKPIDLEVVHKVVGVIGRSMAGGALGFGEEKILAFHFG